MKTKCDKITSVLKNFCVYQNKVWDSFDNDKLRIASAMLAHAVATSQTPIMIEDVLLGVENDIMSIYNDRRN